MPTDNRDATTADGPRSVRLARPLLMLGLAVMLLGAIDPLEGAVVILAGAGAAALGAVIGRRPEGRTLAAAFMLVALGVAALFALSAVGGVGGRSGHSNWWGLLLLPYPVGWMIALVMAFRAVRRSSPRPLSPRSS